MADDPTMDGQDEQEARGIVDQGAVETRAAAEVGGVDFAQRLITVIAVPYEQPALVQFQREVWNEVFSRTAFNGIETTTRRVPATACLSVPNVNHDDGKLVGRASAFYPERSEGLVTDLKISRTTLGDETLELANDGALDVSVGFAVRNRLDQQLDRTSRTRRINRAFLDHIAFVAQPAYAGAKVLAVRTEGGESGIQSDTPLLDKYLDDPLLQWARDYRKS
jgi:HK97 family phage prohead protease